MKFKNQEIGTSQVKLTMPNENWFSLSYHDFKFPEKRLLLLTLPIIFLLYFVFSFLLSNNYQKQKNIPKTQILVSTITKKHQDFVDVLIGSQFKYGTWRYINSEIKDNKIKSYIQIPLKLQMEKDYQKNYIQKALCPNKNHPLWKHIKPSQLEIHLYTGYKHNSVYAKCG